VEEFILDRTLDRAIEEGGVEGLKLIDPACGSGHFLLGAFKRLLEQWHRVAPAMDTRERVQQALDSIHGVDLNPFAVAIARFRLTIAALYASNLTRLEQAPAFRYHLAVGDSLLHGSDQLPIEGLDPSFHEDVALSGFTYAAEDLDALREILRPGQYDVVVANPPYIAVKDKALNDAYRRVYKSCRGKYALSVPFCERLFQLAKSGDVKGEGGGWVGQITSNSFMKREFGVSLVTEFLPRKDILEVIDTSGAYIPGHGIPTVIIVGRNRSATNPVVRAVLGVRGEPSAPEDPRAGLVWTSIVDNVDSPNARTSFVTVTDLERNVLCRHPWTLAGGGAVELREILEKAAGRQLKKFIHSIGITSFTLEDDVFVIPDTAVRRRRIEAWVRPMVLGDGLRDWANHDQPVAIFPYDRDFNPITVEVADPRLLAALWPYRTNLASSVMFGGLTKVEAGLKWSEYGRLTASKLRIPRSIALAFVATHNHFVFDRGGKVFNRTAPVIKLPQEATEDEHLRMLGLLNSSTACFWLKQVGQPRGGDPLGHEGARVSAEAWSDRYEFTGTKLEEFPIPDGAPLGQSRRLDRLAQELQTVSPQATSRQEIPTRDRFDLARERWEATRAEMIAVQEELDWEVYRLYGLLDDDVTYQGDDLPGLAFGERGFEIVLARKIATGQEGIAWFERHRSTPRTEIPTHWPPAYRELVESRIALIEERPDLALIERPECKRRWATKPWAEQEKEALRDWVLDRLEEPALWSDPQGRPQPQSVSQLADRVRRDPDLLSVLELLVGRPDYQLTAELARLLAEQAVPFLAAYRYTESGLRKRAEWEQVWALQRREDAGEQVGPIPVPPRHKPADFIRTSYWQQRGKLDVPKERFVAYTGSERDTDPAAVFGWAGWDHLKQARALATLVLHRSQQDGWTGDRLKPLLAGIAELEPWLHQWHHDPDPEYGGSPAGYISAFLDQQLGEVGCTRQELAGWQPEAVRRGRGRRRAAAGAEARP
jgi:hypothetical protein